MSVRDPSRRKALKYGAMAALGLGAGVALGDVTGADRLVHAASPSGSDPVFSGTGIQFPSLTSDPSQLVGNMWYRSDLTAMKYSDGTNAHELAALDIAQTFTAAQTFNGGIVFNAAGSIASTSTYIEADGAGGNLLVNLPTGKTFNFLIAGTETTYIDPNGRLVFIPYTGASSPSTRPYFGPDDGGNLYQNVPTGDTINWQYAGATKFQLSASGYAMFAGVNTVGLGVPAEYASTLTTAVAIGTTSTVIKTYTPTADGQFLVVVSVEASVASTISSLTVTYTDATSGVSTTQTLATSVAVALNSAVTFTALCDATTASAISVQATAAAATDLYASATVLAL